MVSESLQNLLLGEFTLAPEVGVTILPPYESGVDRRINLYLYKVQESPALRNMDWQARAENPGRLVPPPLSLHLFYLMTPYTLLDPQTGNSASHEILGEAMRIFYENPIIPSDYLVEELRDSREQIKIIQNRLDLEEMSHIWATFSQPYRLSVAYEVSVVQLDMLPESERTMAGRVRQVGVPDVHAPFKPPEVTAVSPLSAAAGSTVIVSGRNLDGWRAYVSIMRRSILQGEELEDDGFEVTIPADLQPGFYEMRIDISHLTRKTLFFEVIS